MRKGGVSEGDLATSLVPVPRARKDMTAFIKPYIEKSLDHKFIARTSTKASLKQ